MLFFSEGWLSAQDSADFSRIRPLEEGTGASSCQLGSETMRDFACERPRDTFERLLDMDFYLETSPCLELLIYYDINYYIFK